MPPDQSRAPRTLPILFSVIIIDLIGFGIVLPVLPFIAKEHGASPAVLGLLLTSYAAMQFLFAPIWGRLSDRVGRRPVMLATIAGSSVCLLILGLAESLSWLFVARILGGAFAANISVATAYLSDVTEADERTRWMGMVGASFGIGFLLGPAIGGVLSPYGYGVPMLVASVMAAVNFVWASNSLKEPERHFTKEEGPSVRALLRDNLLVRRICALNLFFSLAVTQLESMFAFLMLDRFGYDARQVAMILVLMAAVMAGIQGGGIRHLAKRYGEKNLLVAGTAMMALAFAAIPQFHRVDLLLIPLIASAVGRAISQPSMMSMVSLAAPERHRGAVMGSFQAAASLARTFGPVIAGLLYSLDQAWPFLLAAGLMGVAIWLGLDLPSTEDAQVSAAQG
jgi:DHA1 family tetracycline resistance protein-like MFS transporter